MTTLALNSVCKSYGAESVLRDISFEVSDGEMIVIVGPSGCGKSSLLRMVAGLEPITAGEVLINGEVVNDIEPGDRDIAMVFQNYALYPHMTVFRNMAYGLSLRKLPKAEVEARVTKTAEMLGLESLLDRKPAELSGGQRQRVAMGRAIVRKPAIFLFDEPLSNLDAKLRVRMRLEIKELQQRLGVTSLYVTHDQVEAMTLADRLILLNEGGVEQIDTPVNVYRKPASVYVAGFIGTPAMNLLEGKTVSDQIGVIELAGGLQVRLSRPVPRASDSELITLGIRPDQIDLCDKEKADFSCTVTAVEALGSETLVYCSNPANAVPPESGVIGNPGPPFIVKMNGNQQPRLADVLHLQIKPDETHLFHTVSGRRVISD